MNFRKPASLILSAALILSAVHPVSVYASDNTMSGIWTRSAGDYYYSTLTDNEKGFYDALDSSLKSFSDNYTDFTSEPDPYSSEKIFSVSKVEYRKYNIDFQRAFEIYTSYRHEHPLAYFAGGSLSADSRFVTVYASEEYAKGKTRKKINDDILKYIISFSEAGSIDSEYYRALFIHDRLCDLIQYAHQDSSTVSSESPLTHSIIGPVEYGRAVCDGYTNTYGMLLNYYGIKNVFIAGTGNGGGHSWNALKLDDGKYYNFDITWDDGDNDDIYYDFLAKGNKSFSIEHTADLNQILPAISDSDFSVPDDGFSGMNVSLSGDLTLNYYTSLDPETLSDSKGYIHFTSPSGINEKVPFSSGRKNSDSLVFSCSIRPDQMAEPVRARIVYGNGYEGKSMTYSVKYYFSVLHSSSSVVTDLIDAIRRYGAYSQLYTGYMTDSLAAEAEDYASNYTIDDSYSCKSEGNTDIKVKAATLQLASKTTVRVRYQLPEGRSADSYSFSCPGKELRTETSGNEILVYIDDISPEELDHMFVITASSENEKLSFSYSPFTYMKNVFENPEKYDRKTTNLMNSMYEYCMAAKAYMR